jgi:hypothetical protein
MIQARSDLDFDIKFSIIQFYAIEHNSKLNHWIELKLYQKIPELCFYVGVIDVNLVISNPQSRLRYNPRKTK